jgi:Fe-S-cluster containining protein
MSKCNQCGVCCKLFLINLNEDEYFSRKYVTEHIYHPEITNFSEVEDYGLNFIKQNIDGSCFYLKDNNCSIHEVRPAVCREFFCTTTEPKFQQMVRGIAEFKNKNA